MVGPLPASPTEPATRRWFSCDRNAIAWREWGEDFVFYTDDSAATHQVAPVAGQLVLMLLEQPAGLSPADMLHRLDPETAPEAAEISALEQVLEGLAHAGLAQSRVY